MRSIFAALALFAGFAGGSAAHAQNVSDPAVATIDCPADAVATNVEGVAVNNELAEPAGPVAPFAPTSDSDLCSDSRDPRCAPLSPGQDRSPSSSLSDLPRFLGFDPMTLPAMTSVVLPETASLEPTRPRGPVGVRFALDRPPRAA